MDTPSFSDAPVNLDEAMKEARENRPELRRLRLQADINNIDLQYFRNQTKPQFDLARHSSHYWFGGYGSSIAPSWDTYSVNFG